MKTLTNKQLLRNSLEMAIAYNNSVDAINSLIARKELAQQRIAELQLIINYKGGKRNAPEEAGALDKLRAFVNSFDEHASITIDGRSPQNKGMRQFMVFGRTNIMANTIWNIYSLEQAYKFLLHSIDFNEDLRLKDARIFKCNSIKLLYVITVDSSNRPLTWEWINWDGRNHELVWKHNESVTFTHSVELYKKGIEAIKEPGNYVIAGMHAYVRAEDLDFIPKKGMNYNLRKILSAINHGYVGVTNWAE